MGKINDKKSSAQSVSHGLEFEIPRHLIVILPSYQLFKHISYG